MSHLQAVDPKRGWSLNSRLKILLIEDDARLRTTLCQLLVQSGFEVHEAEEGNSGIGLIEQQTFDLVITDVIMPGKEGMETILELRKSHPELKIIAMSGGGSVRSAEYLVVAQAAGAHATIAKPFPFDRLLTIIQTLVKNSVIA